MNQAQQVLKTHLDEYTKQINEAIKKLDNNDGTFTYTFGTGNTAVTTAATVVSPQKAYWTPAKRRAQSRKIKAHWAKKRQEESVF